MFPLQLSKARNLNLYDNAFIKLYIIYTLYTEKHLRTLGGYGFRFPAILGRRKLHSFQDPVRGAYASEGAARVCSVFRTVRKTPVLGEVFSSLELLRFSRAQACPEKEHARAAPSDA